jgi:LuxR family maltose regulon positive regulatory protein
VIAGRSDPPLPLPRLRARDHVTEIGAADLRFTPEEATAFLNDAMELALSAGDVAALEEVTEGWIAALQLAALSMRGRGDVSGFVESFSGSNRHVLDFLAEEVLERQPEEVRGFLLETSVLERMTAPLCDAVTGRPDGQEMLERLERENLFVVALDDERVWYRYHHLFAEFLRSRLNVENPGLADELHLRASRWYEDGSLLVEAIGHALLGSGADPDYEQAARLIERGTEGAWSRGEGPTVLGWLERCRPRRNAADPGCIPNTPCPWRSLDGQTTSNLSWKKPSRRRAKLPPVRIAGFCWGSLRPSGLGAPVCGGTRPRQ